MHPAISEVKTPYGILALDRATDAKMLKVLEMGHYPNQELISLAQRFLSPQNIAVDIGAHVGTFAVALGRLARAVVAFEPAPATFTLLQRNTSQAHGEFDLRNKGLSSRSGSAHVVERTKSNAGSQMLAPGGEIVVSTLDTEVQHADFIKIDVEGMELQVLLGAERLIQTSRPVVIFEVNIYQLRAHGASPRALEHYFKNHGYRLYFPLHRQGKLALGSVHNATLLTACIAPRSWLFRGDSAPFDLIAVPKERLLPFPLASFTLVLLRVVLHNLLVKRDRLRALMR